MAIYKKTRGKEFEKDSQASMHIHLPFRIIIYHIHTPCIVSGDGA
jgi:hypothetical protein